MPSVADLLASLDAAIPFAKAAGWDPVGLQLGDPAARATSLGLCHEVTDTVVTTLEADPVDLLIAYHPLMFRPTTRFVAGTSASGRAFRLARAGVALGVVHTAFDVVPGGVADALADALGISNATGFGPNWGPDAVKIVTFVPADALESVAAAMAAEGAGRIGKYTGCSFRVAGQGAFTPGAGATPVVGTADAANLAAEVRLEMVASRTARDRVVGALVDVHPYEEPGYDVYEVAANAGFIGRHGEVEPMALGTLADRAAAVLGSVPRVAGDPKAAISTVAVVPGSGAALIGEAARHADVLVTGDVSHHQARDALDKGLSILDVGHVPGERPGLARLYAAVAQLSPVRSLLEFDPDPWS